MTYHATAPETLSHGGFSNFLAGIGGFFRSVGHALVINSTANQRLMKVQRLQAKSDEELAELGIKRDDIVRHCFGDLYHI